MAGQLPLWGLYPNSFGAMQCRRPAELDKGDGRYSKTDRLHTQLPCQILPREASAVRLRSYRDRASDLTTEMFRERFPPWDCILGPLEPTPECRFDRPDRRHKGTHVIAES